MQLIHKASSIPKTKGTLLQNNLIHVEAFLFQNTWLHGIRSLNTDTNSPTNLVHRISDKPYKHWNKTTLESCIRLTIGTWIADTHVCCIVWNHYMYRQGNKVWIIRTMNINHPLVLQRLPCPGTKGRLPGTCACTSPAIPLCKGLNDQEWRGTCIWEVCR